MRTIADAWRAFDEMVIPDGAPGVQRREMQRAFYAGAYEMLALAIGIGAGKVSDEEGIALLDAWRRELETFFEGGRP